VIRVRVAVRVEEPGWARNNVKAGSPFGDSVTEVAVVNTLVSSTVWRTRMPDRFSIGPG
jgi:hypothetical protein